MTVPVLLVGGIPVTEPLPPSSGARSTVLVFGMHHSGTKALVEYVLRHFECDVEPLPRKRFKNGWDTGTLHLESGEKRWKHTVPRKALQVGPPNAGGPVLLLCTVRDVLPWMHALAQRPYEIYPEPHRKRRSGSLEWLLSDVKLHTSRDSDGGSTFPSCPALWATYVEGYLSGNLRARPGDGHACRSFVVRHEDIVLQPAALVQALEALGLPRNDQPFGPVEESVSNGLPRADLVQQMCSGRHRRLHGAQEQRVRERVREQLPSGCRALMPLLGYEPP